MNARARLQVDTISHDGMTTIVEFLDVESITDPETRDAVAQIIDEYVAAAFDLSPEGRARTRALLRAYDS